MATSAIIEAERVRLGFARRARQMANAERRAELIIGAAFLALALALPLTAGLPRPLSLPIAAMYAASLAVAGRLRFDVGAAFTVPTQLVFVPLLFALPVTLVPLVTVLALALGMVPSALRGRIPASRMLAVPGNSWFSVGPTIVLMLGHAQQPDRAWALLPLALVAQLICDFAANATRERICGSVTLRDLLVEVRWVYLFDAALSPVGLVVALASRHTSWAVLLIAPLLAVLSVFSRERRARLEQVIELNDAYRGTALVLGDVVEADDSYTGEHCKSVVVLAVTVAKAMGLDAERCRNVEFGALLHDVGKIGVPSEIINKPGKLDADEWTIIKTHTIEGQKLLDRVGGIMREVGQIVRSSHERWDGQGYPDGLVGEAIPLESRIISACDAFNAMTTTRSYRKAMPADDALLEMISNAGTQFDPRVVETLMKVTSRPGEHEQLVASALFPAGA